VAVLGPGLKRWWTKLGVPEERIVVAPNAIDLPTTGQDATSPRLQGGPARLLYVGRLSPEKGGVDDLLRALQLLTQCGLAPTLDVIGDGSLRIELDELARQLGIAARVRFQGSLDQAEIAGFYRRADLVILPSRGEMMPRVMLEAWAYGAPFAATPVGAIPDYLQDGDNGFLLPDPSPVGIATRLADALSDSERLARVGEAGRHSAAQLSWRYAVAALVEEALAPVAGGNGGDAARRSEPTRNDLHLTGSPIVDRPPALPQTAVARAGDRGYDP